MNTFVHSSAVQQALIEARKRACVRVYVGGKRLFGHLWARYSIHGGVTVARSTRRFAPSMRSRRNGRNERSREERRALSPRVNGRFLTRVCGRGAAVWASEGSAKYTRWWNRRWIHQATRSVDTVMAKRSKRSACATHRVSPVSAKFRTLRPNGQLLTRGLHILPTAHIIYGRWQHSRLH